MERLPPPPPPPPRYGLTPSPTCFVRKNGGRASGKFLLTSLIISSLTTRFISTLARWIERSEGPGDESKAIVRSEPETGKENWRFDLGTQRVDRICCPTYLRYINRFSVPLLPWALCLKKKKTVTNHFLLDLRC